MIAIIDADSLIWSLCYRQNQNNRKTLDIKAIDEAISGVLNDTGATHYIAFIGGEKSAEFRYDIDPTYKANRPKKPPFMEIWENKVRRCVIDRWKFIEVEGMETDDACSICHRADWVLNMGGVPYVPGEDNLKISIPTVLCSPDKDMKQIPGRFYDYRKKEGGFISGFQANHNLWKQVLMGDSSDNIKGIPGIGPKKAENILIETSTIACEKCKEGLGDLSSPSYIRVLQQYCAYYKEVGKGLEHFYKNYRLVKLLETSDDFKYPSPEKVEAY